uniref:Uncharacterized protein n=1 Tax=Arundo donax TaxID=35708 RepID=A0A0A8Z7N6_ARUDO
MNLHNFQYLHVFTGYVPLYKRIICNVLSRVDELICYEN